MKTKKSSKTSNISLQTKIIISIVLIVLFAALLSWGMAKRSYYNQAADQASSAQIRELILLAIRGVKKDAPVEPRTGDVYFPEAKLYLPNPGLPLTLTYLFDTGDIADAQSGLSVSTYPVRGTEALYTAKNIEGVFDAVPHLQACSRGIKVAYAKFPANDTENLLKHQVKLNNGKTAYIYLEKSCPELSDTADLFVNIKSY